jgi:hypothetical protein
MSKELEIKVQQDHIESLTRSNGINAIAELIWNSLDADATEIRVNYSKNVMGKYEYITVEDNGTGLSYQLAEDVFQKLGGSDKKINPKSPSGRSYHGKEGKGRYKALALGDLVQFDSYYNISEIASNHFTITISSDSLKNPKIGDVQILNEVKKGFKVTIVNINDKVANEIFLKDSFKELEEKFASYYLSYPYFQIFINNRKVDFDNLIKCQQSEPVKISVGNNLFYSFEIKIIEWNFDNKKKTYLCNKDGIPFLETTLGIRSAIPISIFIQSIFIETLHKQNDLNVAELNPYLLDVIGQSKELAREYVRKRLHVYSKEFISELKTANLYPYYEEAKDNVEIAKRQVFDIVALQINEYLPSFGEQDNVSKKLTLSLVKEALENNTASLQKILAEVIGLPDEKREELADILEKTSLENIIDTMRTVTDRIDFLNGLELLIYDPEYSKKVKERKHLHKIIINETWVFGDDYTYGADDLTLKNVLKQYLKNLGRDDFEEIVNSEDNSDLETIPDVCLWKQYNLGKADYFENLIIELKKPTKDAGFTELTQIDSYASKVSNDTRFPKEKTKWTFILLVRNIKDELKTKVEQEHRRYGHVTESKYVDVFVLRWSDIIHAARAKYKYIKDKLDLNLQTNEDALSLLREKYKKYLPDEF